MPDAAQFATEFKDFLYLVSHDLGAPVRGMVEFSRLLKAEQYEQLNEDGRLYLSLIIENGEKLQKMMSSLLDFSRLNTRPIQLTTVNLNKLVAECQIELKDQLLKSGGKILSTKLPDIKTDIDHAKLVFYCLIDNALKFHAEGIQPVVKIASETTPEGHVFSFSDNGIGVAQNLRSDIFKAFKRLHGDSDYPGVGMGLALVQKICDLHGGQAWVETSSNQGSVFKLRLPKG